MAFIEPVEFVSKSGKKILIRNIDIGEAIKLRDAAALIAETSPYIISTPESFRKKTEDDQIRFIKSYNEDPTGLLIVAESDQQFVGIFNFGNYKDAKRKHRGSLGISLHPDFRGQGVAKKLFLVAIEKIKTFKEIIFVELDVMDCNHEAVQLYQSVGFEFLHSAPKCFHLPSGELVGDIRMRLEVKK